MLRDPNDPAAAERLAVAKANAGDPGAARDHEEDCLTDLYVVGSALCVCVRVRVCVQLCV